MDPFGGDEAFGEPVSAPAPVAAAPLDDGAALLDDPLASAVGQAAADAPAAEALDMSDFQEPAQAAAPVPALDLAADVVQLSSEDTQAAFIGGFTPHPVDPPAVPPSPAVADPRVAWHKKNQAALAAKDKEEAEERKAAAEKAKAFVSKFHAERTKNLESSQKKNRAAEKASPEAGVPNGATWEKVNLLINFKREDKSHTKDMSRFKAVLNTCKTLNVPVAIPAK